MHRIAPSVLVLGLLSAAMASAVRSQGADSCVAGELCSKNGDCQAGDNGNSSKCVCQRAFRGTTCTLWYGGDVNEATGRDYCASNEFFVALPTFAMYAESSRVVDAQAACRSVGLELPTTRAQHCFYDVTFRTLFPARPVTESFFFTNKEGGYRRKDSGGVDHGVTSHYEGKYVCFADLAVDYPLKRTCAGVLLYVPVDTRRPLQSAVDWSTATSRCSGRIATAAMVTPCFVRFAKTANHLLGVRSLRVWSDQSLVSLDLQSADLTAQESVATKLLPICADNDCQTRTCVRGECVETLPAYHCQCPAGWMGFSCELDATYLLWTQHSRIGYDVLLSVSTVTGALSDKTQCPSGGWRPFCFSGAEEAALQDWWRRDIADTFWRGRTSGNVSYAYSRDSRVMSLSMTNKAHVACTRRNAVVSSMAVRRHYRAVRLQASRTAVGCAGARAECHKTLGFDLPRVQDWTGLRWSRASETLGIAGDAWHGECPAQVSVAKQFLCFGCEVRWNDLLGKGSVDVAGTVTCKDGFVVKTGGAAEPRCADGFWTGLASCVQMVATLRGSTSTLRLQLNDVGESPLHLTYAQAVAHCTAAYGPAAHLPSLSDPRECQAAHSMVKSWNWPHGWASGVTHLWIFDPGAITAGKVVVISGLAVDGLVLTTKLLPPFNKAGVACVAN